MKCSLPLSKMVTIIQNPSNLTAESALDCFVPAPGSTVGIQHKAKGKGDSSLHDHFHKDSAASKTEVQSWLG